MHVLFSLGLSFTVLAGACGHAKQPMVRELWNIERIPVGNAPGSVEIANVNNDGFPDLAVTSETDSSITVLIGNGRGGFKVADNSPFYAGPNPNDIAWGDFNMDGNIDLAVANHEKKYLTILQGNGKGIFVPFPQSPVHTTGIPHTHGIAIGDFNQDGRPDLATDSWGNNEVEVLFGDSISLFKKDEMFFRVGKRPYQRLRTADLNRDGIDDIVTTNTESNDVTILLGGDKAGFKTAGPFAGGDNPFGLAIGDVNADGFFDLAVINSPASMAEGKGINGMTVLMGDGEGNFSRMKGSPFEAGKIPNRIAIGDVNGDGVNDIASSDNASNTIYLFVMSRNGQVLSQSVITVGTHPKGVAISDLNGDKKADIVVCNNGDNDISIVFSK